MSGFIPVFGGGSVSPANLAFQSYALTASIQLAWPAFASSSQNAVAAIMEVTANNTGYSITMPTAMQATVGQQVLIRNIGGNTIAILDNSGGNIGNVASGAALFLYLKDNSTAAGTWSNVTFGTGSSSADSASLAGMGLIAVTTTLNQSHPVVEVAASTTVVAGDRAKAWVVTGGGVTFTLPACGTVGSNFFFLLKNGGSGTVTVNPVGGDLIDGTGSLALAPNDAVMLCSSGGTGHWYSIGKGQSVSFVFTQLVKSVAGAVDVTLTASEASNKILKLSGALTGNINVIVPAAAAVYYVNNVTSGAFSLTIKTPAGTGVPIAQGTTDIVECDATNVFKAITNTVATTAFAVGAVATPSIAFSGFVGDGFWHPNANQVAVSCNGVQAMQWDTVTSGVNFLDAVPAATGAGPILSAAGTDANISLNLQGKGATGTVVLRDTNGKAILTGDVPTGSAVNGFTMTNSATGTAPILKSTGTDANIGLIIKAKGTGSILLQDPAGATIMTLDSSDNVGIGMTPVAANGILQLGSYASIKALLETATITAASPSATQNFDAITQAVQWFTTNAANNWTLNVRGNSGTTLNAIMQIGQATTVVVMSTQGASPFYQSALTVDGGAVTPKWQGGTAPSAGNASGVDMYTVTIVKTANATFSAFAAQTQYK